MMIYAGLIPLIAMIGSIALQLILYTIHIDLMVYILVQNWMTNIWSMWVLKNRKWILIMLSQYNFEAALYLYQPLDSSGYDNLISYFNPFIDQNLFVVSHINKYSYGYFYKNIVYSLCINTEYSHIILNNYDISLEYMTYSDIIHFYDTWKYNFEYLKEYNIILSKNIFGNETFLTKAFAWCKSLEWSWLNNILDIIFGKKKCNYDYGQSFLYRRDFDTTWSAYVYDNAFFRKYKICLYSDTDIFPYKTLMPTGINFKGFIAHNLPYINIININLNLDENYNFLKNFSSTLSNLNSIHPWFFDSDEIAFIYHNRRNDLWIYIYMTIFYISLLPIICIILFISNCIIIFITWFSEQLLHQLPKIFTWFLKSIKRLDTYISDKYLYTKISYLYIKKNYLMWNGLKATIRKSIRLFKKNNAWRWTYLYDWTLRMIIIMEEKKFILRFNVAFINTIRESIKENPKYLNDNVRDELKWKLKFWNFLNTRYLYSTTVLWLNVRFFVRTYLIMFLGTIIYLIENTFIYVIFLAKHLNILHWVIIIINIFYSEFEKFLDDRWLKPFWQKSVRYINWFLSHLFCTGNFQFVDDLSFFYHRNLYYLDRPFYHSYPEEHIPIFYRIFSYLKPNSYKDYITYMRDDLVQSNTLPFLLYSFHYIIFTIFKFIFIIFKFIFTMFKRFFSPYQNQFLIIFLYFNIFYLFVIRVLLKLELKIFKWIFLKGVIYIFISMLLYKIIITFSINVLILILSYRFFVKGYFMFSTYTLDHSLIILGMLFNKIYLIICLILKILLKPVLFLFKNIIYIMLILLFYVSGINPAVLLDITYFILYDFIIVDFTHLLFNSMEFLTHDVWTWYSSHELAWHQIKWEEVIYS